MDDLCKLAFWLAYGRYRKNFWLCNNNTGCTFHYDYILIFLWAKERSFLKNIAHAAAQELQKNVMRALLSCSLL